MISKNYLNTIYVHPEDYAMVMGYELDLEVARSDHPELDGQRLCHECERKMLGMLHKFSFDESMITDENRDDFIGALCYQIRNMINLGYDAPLDATAKTILQDLGFLNVRRW